MRKALATDFAPATAWLLGFCTVLALSLGNGGFDEVSRGRVGAAVWWVVLLGALAGVFPRRVPAVGWIAIGLLAAVALWTGAAVAWSESSERTVTELARATTYLGVLVLGLCVVARSTARPLLAGVAAAIALVASLAVLSRTQMQWFPHNDDIDLFGTVGARRLSYPLNSWNALGAFAAMGVPLLLALSIGARTIAARALSSAVLPVVALCMYLTVSRGSILVVAVAVVVLLALAPRTWTLLCSLGLAAVGSALLIAVARSHAALRSGLDTPQAHSDGELMLLAIAGVAVATGLARWAGESLWMRVEMPALPWTGLSRRDVRATALAVCTLGLVALAFGAHGEIEDRWREFKAPPTVSGRADDLFGRVQAVNGSGRYQVWQAALAANRSHPWRGIGPGTFELWWSRHPRSTLFVRDAHSLYFETLGESGIIGLALLAAWLLFVLFVALRRIARTPPGTRLWLAAATASIAGFMTSSALDWVWEVAAVPAAMLLLTAVALAGDHSRRRRRRRTRHPLRRRAGVAVLAVIALPTIIIPLSTAQALRSSQQAVQRGELSTALADARGAERLEPFAASPLLQRALVLERLGDLPGSERAARRAIDAEPTNWEPWLVVARVASRRGERVAARQATARVRRLNRLLPIRVN